MKLFLSYLTITFLLLIQSCDTFLTETDPPDIPIPELVNDGWEVASIPSVGMETQNFLQLIDKLEKTENHRIHSIIVVKENKLVFEKYYNGRKFNLGQYTGGYGYNRNDLHVLCSATKSITSALLGIAIDKGFIKSVDEKVFNFFPEHNDLISSSPSKADMTIKHLLTMTSGFDYDDESLPYTDSRNDMNRFFTNSNPIRFLLAKPLFAQSGDVFDYDNCNTNIIGQIIYNASEKRIDQFANDYLFSKLGISNYEWQFVRGNVILCSGDLHLKPRDMAKFGLLFLNKGKWNGEQIISNDWCSISTTACLNPNNYNNEFPWANGYGYQWWQKSYSYKLHTYNYYFASGWGGQNIFVIPQLNLVVVTTAGNWEDYEIISPFTIVSDYIIPSVK